MAENRKRYAQRVTVKIATTNAAMLSYGAVADALVELAGKLRRDPDDRPEQGDVFYIQDENGNTVGKLTATDQRLTLSSF